MSVSHAPSMISATTNDDDQPRREAAVTIATEQNTPCPCCIYCRSTFSVALLLNEKNSNVTSERVKRVENL